MTKEYKENEINYGILIVITGRSGAGKDAVFNKIIEQDMLQLGFSQVVTHATREPRANEKHAKDYYFVTEEELFLMFNRNELVEEPVPTGTSHKGTSKKELEKIIEGKNLVWRIDIERAAEVANGDFFKRIFPEDVAEILFERTRVVYIDVDDETLKQRRQKRDLDQYKEGEYVERDKLERALINMHKHKFTHVIQNLDNKLDETVFQIEKIVKSLL